MGGKRQRGRQTHHYGYVFDVPGAETRIMSAWCKRTRLQMYSRKHADNWIRGECRWTAGRVPLCCLLVDDLEIGPTAAVSGYARQEDGVGSEALRVPDLQRQSQWQLPVTSSNAPSG